MNLSSIIQAIYALGVPQFSKDGGGNITGIVNPVGGTFTFGGGGSAETYTTLSIASLTTSATPNAGGTIAFASATCNGMIVTAGAVPIEYQRGAAGAFYTIRAFEKKFIYGISNASDIAFRRVDYATARTTQVTTVTAELINTSASYNVKSLSVTASSNATYTAFGSYACTALEVKNASNKHAFIKVNSGTAIQLRRNESRLITGITNANQVSVVTFDSSGNLIIQAEAFQAYPVLPRHELNRAQQIEADAPMYLGEMSYIYDAFAMPSFFAPIKRKIPQGQTISMFTTVANANITGGTSSDTTLASDETYGTYSAITQFGSRTALTNTFGGSTTNSFTSNINTISPIDVTNGAIHLALKRIGAAGTVSNVFIDLFSAGTPTAPSANYHTLDVFADLDNGFSKANGYGARGYGINLFNVVGSGATLTAITYARIRVTGTAGLVVRPEEVKFVKNSSAKASIIFTFDDNHASAVTAALPLLAAYGFPGVLYPSPNATNTGNNNNTNGNLSVDNMLILQNRYGWQIASQDFYQETSIDMTPAQWLQQQGKNFVIGAALGFDLDGLRDSSYAGGGSYYITSEQYKVSPRIHTSLRRFDNGIGTLGDGVKPFYFADTNPPADPWNLRALNINSYGSTGGTAPQIAAKLQLYVDQAIANKGIAILSAHSDWGTSEIKTAMTTLLAYIKTQVDAGNAEVVTLQQMRNK